MATTPTTKPELKAVELEFESRVMELEPRQLELAGSARSTTVMRSTEYTIRLAESTCVSTVATSKAKPTVATKC